MGGPPQKKIPLHLPVLDNPGEKIQRQVCCQEGGGRMYFESQSLFLCALHCCNNLLQREAFKKADFDDIARNMGQVLGT